MMASANTSIQHSQCEALQAWVQERLSSAPLTSAYHAALSAALALPGNILSDQPNMRWARLVWTTCMAAGGSWQDALPAAATVEVFMTALDILDDIEDGEPHPLDAELGPARALNVTTGLILMTQWCLLDTPIGASALRILLGAGLQACSGQHSDLTPLSEQHASFNTALAITQDKSAALVAAICWLGALCAAADRPTQERYAHFGFYVGMVRQLHNDIAGIHPEATEKTDVCLERPTLPLMFAALQPVPDSASSAPATGDLWSSGSAYLTWTVAEVYRRQALELIPNLTDDPGSLAALTALIPA
jgi:geranylgeranyl diphosphate synthase type I